jgi:hypothetical protein
MQRAASSSTRTACRARAGPRRTVIDLGGQDGARHERAHALRGGDDGGVRGQREADAEARVREVNVDDAVQEGRQRLLARREERGQHQVAREGRRRGGVGGRQVGCREGGRLQQRRGGLARERRARHQHIQRLEHRDI